MPLNGRHRFTSREHRMAMHVKSSEKKEGKDEETAERIAWATVNKDKQKFGIRSLKSK